MRYTEARAILSEAIEQLDETKLLQRQISPGQQGGSTKFYPTDDPSSPYHWYPTNDEPFGPSKWFPLPAYPGDAPPPPIDLRKPPPPLRSPKERLQDEQDRAKRKDYNDTRQRDRLRDFRKKIQDGLNQKPYQRPYVAPSGPGAGWNNPYSRPSEPPHQTRPDFD